MEYHNRYLDLLRKKYPNIEACRTELINLEAILSLPKGTEHFLSDLHGEYDAFQHILNNCSGVIREKVDSLFKDMKEEEKRDFCTLIYYPKEKLVQNKNLGILNDEWYLTTLINLINLTSYISSKYTRSKVKKSISEGYQYIIDELLHTKDNAESNIRVYFTNILNAIIYSGGADDFIIEFARVIKRLAIDHLHVVGDIYDRGPKPDYIIDILKEHHSLDIEWGNHDILWIGAQAGIPVCVFTVLYNNLKYGNNRLLENSYGISIRKLVDYSRELYGNEDNILDPLIKTILIILTKLEGNIIKRNPDFDLNSRLVLYNLDLKNGTYNINGENYILKDSIIKNIDNDDPYYISQYEQSIIDSLCYDFSHSVRLHDHIKFLVENGSTYKCYNGNLLFHGCIPLDEEGNFKEVKLGKKTLSGKKYLDEINKLIVNIFNHNANEYEMDYMYYLWGGYDSPFTGRIYKTFELYFLNEVSLHKEPRNPYYEHRNSVNKCKMLLNEFGLNPKYGHIINGHIPVKAKSGETPVLANGKLIIIDGGLCKAYHKRTGIAGYTLIFSSRVLRIKAHEEFSSKKDVIVNNNDILSDSKVIENFDHRILVKDSDNGKIIQEEVSDLKELLAKYQKELKYKAH